MLGYRHKQLQREGVDEDADLNVYLSYEYNEKVYKMYRGHRNANCIDGAFIGQVMLQCTGMVIH